MIKPYLDYTPQVYIRCIDCIRRFYSLHWFYSLHQFYSLHRFYSWHRLYQQVLFIAQTVFVGSTHCIRSIHSSINHESQSTAKFTVNLSQLIRENINIFFYFILFFFNNSVNLLCIQPNRKPRPQKFPIHNKSTFTNRTPLRYAATAATAATAAVVAFKNSKNFDLTKFLCNSILAHRTVHSTLYILCA